MNRDDIIRMAREAGLWSAVTDVFPKELERFTTLVAEHERNRLWTQEHWTDYEFAIAKKAAADEREACARVVEQYTGAWSDEGYALAQQIRARGKE